jgi:hypothetical protein
MRTNNGADKYGRNDFIRKDLDNGIQGLQAGDIGFTDSVNGSFFDMLVGGTIKAVSADRQGKDATAIVSHVFIYFGSGKHEIVEAIADGIKRTKIDLYLRDRSQFLVYRNKNLTVEQLTKIKDYVYGRVDKVKYGYTDLLKFVFPFLPSNPTTDFCSEIATTAYNKAGIKASLRKPDETSPDDMVDFFNTRAGQREGWYCADSFNITRPRPTKYP